MSYPEHGAGYKHKPAWLDRAVAGEKRATGGGIDAGSVEDRGPSKADPAPSEADWRKSKFKEDRDFYGTKRHSPVSEGSQKEISGTVVNDMRRADGGKISDVKPLKIEQSNIHKPLTASELAERSRPLPTRRSGEPNFGEPGYTGRKRGGAVKRAEGGATKYPNKIPGLTDEQIDANEARRPPGYDGRDQIMAQPKMDTGDRIEATPINQPKILRGKKPL